MGNVIVISRAKPLPFLDLDAGHSAEILFFTGVRYYRMEEPAELSVPKVANRLASKRLRSPDQRRAAKLKRDQKREALG